MSEPHLAVGTQVSIRGHLGRFRVMKLPHETSDASIQVWGPVTGLSAAKARVRSFRPAQITKIHQDIEKETCPPMQPPTNRR